MTNNMYNNENNIASDIRLSRNVVNKESKSSRRFVCICNTSSGDNNFVVVYLKFVLALQSEMTIYAS